MVEPSQLRTGDYVRVYPHAQVDNDPSVLKALATDIGDRRPLDYGQVRDPRTPGKVTVRWFLAEYGCDSLDEDPADLIKVTEAEYNAWVAGCQVGWCRHELHDEQAWAAQ